MSPKIVEAWVVTPDGKVAAKGVATVAGRPGNYGFVLYAYDAEPDGYRLVAWPPALAGGRTTSGRSGLQAKVSSQRRGADLLVPADCLS